MVSIDTLKSLQESEDRIEFKEAKNQFNYNNGRKSLLAYIVALANEGGGRIVLGMKDTNPHEVTGTDWYCGTEGKLEQKIYHDLQIQNTKARAGIRL